MMQRLLPHPAQSLLLLCTWLLLVDSIAFGHWLLGGFLAIVIPLLLGPLLVEHPRAWKPLRLLRYLLMVIGDILVANFQVARLTLGASASCVRPSSKCRSSWITSWPSASWSAWYR